MKTLLLKVRQQIESRERRYSGICLAALDLHIMGEINQTDFFNLKHFISENRPSIDSKHYYNMGDSDYFWPKYEIEPRLSWLDDMINSI